jgi:hypothetical protein
MPKGFLLLGGYSKGQLNEYWSSNIEKKNIITPALNRQG